MVKRSIEEESKIEEIRGYVKNNEEIWGKILSKAIKKAKEIGVEIVKERIESSIKRMKSYKVDLERGEKEIERILNIFPTRLMEGLEK